MNVITSNARMHDDSPGRARKLRQASRVVREATAQAHLIQGPHRNSEWINACSIEVQQPDHP